MIARRNLRDGFERHWLSYSILIFVGLLVVLLSFIFTNAPTSSIIIEAVIAGGLLLAVVFRTVGETVVSHRNRRN
jgi:uncharacterized membrane protein